MLNTISFAGPKPVLAPKDKAAIKKQNPAVSAHPLPQARDGQVLQSLNALSAIHQAQIKRQSAVKPRFAGGQGAYPFDKVDVQLGDHPKDSAYYNKLDEWRKKIWHEATKPRPGFPKGWLQPEDTLFQMANQTDLMEAAARSGFPTRYSHWSWGQDFNDQYQRQRFGLGRLYEMVINTSPSYAFLYDRNPIYAQKVVMAHVLGHTDFFKNNLMFSESNRNMVRVMADNKAKIERYYQDPKLKRQSVDGVHPVEQFLNQFNSLEWLVEMNALKPPKLDSDVPVDQSAAKSVGKAGVKTDWLGAAPWMQDYLYDHQDWKKYRDKTVNEVDTQEGKTLKKPTRDVLGFLVEHGQGMKPWQKDILRSLREESYYFVPQVRTKLMNEGWATFWHHKIMAESPALVDESETADIAKMMAGVEAPPQNGINPYQVGYAIFDNIYKHAGYGLSDFDTTFQPNKTIRYEDINHRVDKRGFDEVAGLKKVQEVRKNLDDVEFIRQHFTPEVADELGMVVTNEREEWDRASQQRVKVRYVESDDFNQLKEMILQQYQNAFPSITLKDANHNNKGELLMKHDNPVQDLDLKDTRETLKTLNQFYGKPVHLDSILEVELDTPPRNNNDDWRWGGFGRSWQPEPQVKHERQPIRLSYHDDKMEIFLLDKDGKPGKNITNKYF